MLRISDIIADTNRGIIANNLNEDCFTYRIVYFVNYENRSEKHYVDTLYDDLRRTLENIICGKLTTTNNLVIACITTLKNGECVSLLSRSYKYSLNEYFRAVCGNKRRNNTYNRYAVRQKAV